MSNIPKMGHPNETGCFTGWCPKTSGLHGDLSYPRADISPAICGVIPHRTWTPKTNPSTRQKRQSVIMRIIKHDPKCLVDVSIFSIMISESCTPHISKTMSPAVTGSNGFQLLHFRIFHLPRRWGKRKRRNRWAPIQCTSDPTWPRPRTQELYQALKCQWLRRLRHQISSTSTHHKSHIVIYSHKVTLTRMMSLFYEVIGFWEWHLRDIWDAKLWDCQERLHQALQHLQLVQSRSVEQRKNGVLPCGGIFLILSWCRHGRIWQDSTEIPPQLEENASYQSHLPHLPLRTRNYWHTW